jgi:trans-aconitate methyltransferase
MDMVKQTIPWPEIRTTVEEDFTQKVPLKQDYDFQDMWYLDTKQAEPIFKYQAELISQKQSKGIVDIGCRHGPVLKWLDHNFNYMGFDTSTEPISIAEKNWKDYNNIEFRCASWEYTETFLVDFPVDTVIFSGVLLYRQDHFDFFEWVVDFYDAKNAIIQEPWHDQKHWDNRLILNTITRDLDKYRSKYHVREKLLDCDIFAGRRLILDIEI